MKILRVYDSTKDAFFQTLNAACNLDGNT